VRIGLILPLFSGDPDRVLRFARRAEELGFGGLFAFDHFFPPGASSDRPSLEAFSVLAAVGAATSHAAVGTLVTRAQLRPTGLLAKMAAGLDASTGGRVILGIGTGDPIDEPEHRAFGIPSLGKRDRRAHLAETVGALKALFASERWEGGRYVPAMAGPLVPAPRPGGPPVWIGAQADEMVRMAGALADGWNGWGLEAAEFGRKVRILQEEARAAGRVAEATWAGIVLMGRDDDEVRTLLEARRTRGMPDTGIWSGTARGFEAFLRDLEEAGATWAILVPAGPQDRVDLIAETVLASSGRG